MNKFTLGKGLIQDKLREAFGEKIHRGQPPFGYSQKEKVLVENDHEQRILSMMQHWREQEKLSYDTIADRLNGMLIESRKNKKWYGAVVNEILTRQKMQEAFYNEG